MVNLHRHAAVDYEHLSGDVAGFIGGEEGCRVSNVFRLAEVGQGDAGEQGFACFFRDGIGHISRDEAGGNGVDGHLAAGDFLGHGLGEANDAGLGSRVITLAYVAGDADDGGNVDDAACGALHESALQGFDKEENALEVGGDNGIPVAFLHTHEQTVLGDTGIVDQNVDSGVFSQDVLDAGFHYEENIMGVNGKFEQITFYISPDTLQQAIFGLNINYGLSFSSRHSCVKCSSLNFVSERADTPLHNFFVGINISLRNSGLLHNDVGQRIKLNELVYLILSGEDGCIRRKVLRSSDIDSGNFVNIIYENVFNDISIEMLAEMTNRSLTSFKKEFRRLFDAPPHRWIIEQRLDRAKILLASTSRTVSEIGAECAFTNISHFIKLFKLRYKETPAAFRRRHSMLKGEEYKAKIG